MPTAGAVATELRRLADALEKEPETEISRADIWFWHHTPAKKSFLDLVRLMPRPITKKYEEGVGAKLIITYETPALIIQMRIERSAICEIVEPARPAIYKCEPLLSDEEESTLTQD